MDKGRILIYTQGKIATAMASAVETNNRNLALGQCVSGNAANAAAAATTTAAQPHNASANRLQVQPLQSEQTAAAGINAMITSKEAVMASLCRQVALNGFEPIQNVFELRRW